MAIVVPAPWTGGPRDYPWQIIQQEEEQNSTTHRGHSENVEQAIEALCEAAQDEYFEDGMESEFSRGVVSLLKNSGDAGMAALAHLIVYGLVRPAIASEALRWLGRIVHPPSYNYRRWLLERSLTSASAAIRAGAALGLASLDDPHATPYMRQAVDREDIEELRKDLEQVLHQLENRG
jgi:hypothetical protein